MSLSFCHTRTTCSKAMRDHFGFCKDLSCRVTIIARGIRKKQLNSLKIEFNRYFRCVTSLIVIFCQKNSSFLPKLVNLNCEYYNNKLLLLIRLE
jgi:hypothetical protein